MQLPCRLKEESLRMLSEINCKKYVIAGMTEDPFHPILGGKDASC